MHRLYSSFFFPCSVFVLYSHTNLHSSSWISYSRDLSARWPYWIVTVTAQDRLLEMLHFYLATNMKGLLSHIASHRIEFEMRMWFNKSNSVLMLIDLRIECDRWCESDEHMKITCQLYASVTQRLSSAINSHLFSWSVQFFPISLFFLLAFKCFGLFLYCLIWWTTRFCQIIDFICV